MFPIVGAFVFVTKQRGEMPASGTLEKGRDMPNETEHIEEEAQEQQNDQNAAPEVADWETWLDEQPDEIQSAYQDHVSGLKGALESERDERKRLDRERKEREKAAEEAERQRMEEKGQYKELAEKAQARATEAEAQLAELEPMAERVEALEGALTTYLDAEKDGLPDHLLTLLADKPVEAQLAYLTENRGALKKAASGPTPTPRATGTGKMSDKEKRQRSWRVRTL